MTVTCRLLKACCAARSKTEETPKPPLGKVTFAERKCIKRKKTNKQVFSYLLAYLKQTPNILAVNTAKALVVKLMRSDKTK